MWHVQDKQKYSLEHWSLLSSFIIKLIIMKSFFLKSFGLGLTLSLSIAHAASIDQNQPPNLSPNEMLLAQNLKTKYPTLGAKVVGTSPVTGVYEVIVDDTLLYSDQSGKYFFVGNLIDFKKKENLTAMREQQLNKVDVSSLLLAQAIKHVKGKGERILYVFSDPDCPYCQQLEKELSAVDNVTIYTFLYPLKHLHPQAETVSKQIWCSNQPDKAWQDYMLLKRKPTANTSCKNPIAQNLALGQTLKIRGTPTIFLQNGERLAGATKSDAIEAALQQASSTK